MIKRTIKPSAGKSSITLEQAMEAARYVYRDRRTGRLVITKERPSARKRRPATTAKPRSAKKQ